MQNGDDGDTNSRSEGGVEEQKTLLAPGPERPVVDESPDEGDIDEQGVSGAATVFVSYRVDPDHAVAVAVRRLLQGCLHPAPEVFVSGESLRPSSIGYRPQIQAAVQRAKAFIGVITPASKAREWVFFEAGAAWGRGQTYAPLLVDAKPEDLSSSIADYQATNAADKEAVQRLVAGVAGDIGATVKPHFAQRYAAFERALAARNTPSADDLLDPDVRPERREFGKGVRKLVRGDRAGAEEIFEQLRTSLPAKDALLAEMNVATAIYAPNMTPAGCLAKLEALDAETRQSPVCEYWMGVYEQIPAVAIEHLRACVAATTPASVWRGNAIEALVGRLADIGEVEEALRVVHQALVGESRTVRARAAAIFHERWGETDARVRMAVLAFGAASGGTVQVLRLAGDLAVEQGWLPLAVSYGTQLAADKDGTSLTLGRALHASFASAAYRAYGKAASEGTNVAKVNMAILLQNGAVPAAALDIMQSHVGVFDCGDPAAPHRLRMNIEASIHEEARKVAEWERRGNRAGKLLASVAAQVFGTMRSATGLAPAYSCQGDTLRLTKSGTFDYAFSGGAESGTIACPVPEFPMWLLRGQDESVALLAQQVDGALRGFRYDFKNSEATAVPLVLVPSPALGTT